MRRGVVGVVADLRRHVDDEGPGLAVAGDGHIVGVGDRIAAAPRPDLDRVHVGFALRPAAREGPAVAVTVPPDRHRIPGLAVAALAHPVITGLGIALDDGPKISAQTVTPPIKIGRHPISFSVVGNPTQTPCAVTLSVTVSGAVCQAALSHFLCRHGEDRACETRTANGTDASHGLVMLPRSQGAFGRRFRKQARRAAPDGAPLGCGRNIPKSKTIARYS